jgi:MoaA/NifB/PqqE/SkfB family radical SAM enzyme
MPAFIQLAKKAVKARPELFGWLYQPYSDHQFRKRQSHLAATYQRLLEGDPKVGAGVGFAIGHENTIRCNLACKMCYQGNFREDETGVREITLDEIIAAYERTNATEVKLVGSEIFMRKDIYDLLDYLWKRRIPTSLMTNGTLLHAEGIERLRRYDNIEWIGFSIDGSEQVHNAIRRRPYAYARTVKAIRDVMPHFQVAINAVILKDNLHDLASLLHLGKQLGVPFIHYIFEEAYSQQDIDLTQRILRHEMGWEPHDYEICTNIRDGFEYSFQELETAIEELKREGQRIGVYPVFSPDVWSRKLREYYDGTATEKLHLVCTKLVSTIPCFRLDHLGNVHHCGVIRRPFGNLLEQSPEEIWNSDEYRHYRRVLMDKRLLPICKRCCKAAYI